MARHADDDAAEHVDGENDDARNRVAAHELGRAVHRTEEGAFLLQFATTHLRFLVVDVTGREIGVDRHLFAGNRIEREARADFRDTRGALGDDEKVDRDQDREHDHADDEVAAHHQVCEARDDIAGSRRAIRAMRENKTRGGDVERQAQHRRDEQDGRERREVERPVDPQRDHQDQHGKRDRQRESEIDQDGGDRKKEDGQDGDDAAREPQVASTRSATLAACNRNIRHHSSPALRPRMTGEACASVLSETFFDMRIDVLREGEHLLADERS